MVQRRALIEGAALATRLGDSECRELVSLAGAGARSPHHQSLGREPGMITATLDWTGGLGGKSSGLDVAVVLGVLHGAAHGADRGGLFFRPTDERVLATGRRSMPLSSDIYTINARGTIDSNGQALGTAIGRYPEDRYAGDGPLTQGNPWFLATAAYAELYYRAAEAFKKRAA